ncbi:hypothetical protein EDD16DRAFT_453904 [Pisolithus croceorrhizus]|nr:hypothetical protein EV401DRAFT_928821 [Pisolithus croceorrhizus]KAI6125353.1 hypothetical protein EDD16DRAFT_453904 [Pisolithus croceorrhizus]KAI6138677.1 hypothetical protein EDD17DRAFT_391043 [Pisolithus thermaeus]
MSTDISYVDLPFADGVIRLSTRDLEKDTFGYQDLEFEVFDPVPAYHQEELLKLVDHVLDSPESKYELRKAVQDLGDSAYSIEICFRNVADGLREAQAQGTQTQKKQLKGYADKWAVHHKEYVQLLCESRRIAGNARVIANDFSGDFLSLMDTTDITLAEKKAEISAYRKQLDEDAKKSSDLSRRFDHLRMTVENFETDVKEFLGIGRKLEAELQEAVKKVAEVKKEISRLDTILSWSIGISLGTAGIGLGAIALGVLCPALGLFLNGIGTASALKGANAYRQRKEKRGKLADLEKQKAQLEKPTGNLEGMRKIHAILNPLKSDIDLIKDKLVVFGQIWQMIHTDLNAVEKGLELATNSAGVTLFKRRLRTTSKAYTLLVDALYQYETNVHIQRVGKLGD